VTDENNQTVTFEYESGYSLLVPETLKLVAPGAGAGPGGVADGDTFDIANGTDPPVTFEFDAGYSILVPIFGILLVLVPVIGLTTVFTLRFGGKPFVETLASALRGVDGDAAAGASNDRVAELAEQVEALTAEVRQLRAEQSFDRKLLASRPDGIG